ncbi:MAG: type II methionyl aminopeptidase [Nanoarchaeota archaeon]
MGYDYTKEQLADFRKAGEVTAKARAYGAELITVGARMEDVCDKIDAFIRDQGCELAFPSQISVNDCAAHYGAAYEDPFVFGEDHLAKLDLGAMVNGAVGDTAISVDLSTNKRYAKLIEAAHQALMNAIAIVKAGVKTSEIGREIERTVGKYGFTPVMNLSGHGIGINDLHGYPSIPNYDTKDEIVLKEGMTIAIEPFVTDGAGFVVERGESELFMLEGKKPVRSPITRNALKVIQRFKGFPFARRYVDRELGKARVNFALRELNNLGILHSFPPLLDKKGGIVAQAEHSILVTKDGCEILTK